MVINYFWLWVAQSGSPVTKASMQPDESNCINGVDHNIYHTCSTDRKKECTCTLYMLFFASLWLLRIAFPARLTTVLLLCITVVHRLLVLLAKVACMHVRVFSTVVWFGFVGLLEIVWYHLLIAKFLFFTHRFAHKYPLIDSDNVPFNSINTSPRNLSIYSVSRSVSSIFLICCIIVWKLATRFDWIAHDPHVEFTPLFVKATLFQCISYICSQPCW